MKSYFSDRIAAVNAQIDSRREEIFRAAIAAADSSSDETISSAIFGAVHDKLTARSTRGMSRQEEYACRASLDDQLALSNRWKDAGSVIYDVEDHLEEMIPSNGGGFITLIETGLLPKLFYFHFGPSHFLDIDNTDLHFDGVFVERTKVQRDVGTMLTFVCAAHGFRPDVADLGALLRNQSPFARAWLTDGQAFAKRQQFEPFGNPTVFGSPMMLTAIRRTRAALSFVHDCETSPTPSVC